MKKIIIIIGLAIVLFCMACDKHDITEPEEIGRIELGESLKSKAKITIGQISGKVKVRPRSFDNFKELAIFAKTNLGAEIIYQDKKIVGFKGGVRQTGKIVFEDETGSTFERDDFVLAYLGGKDGILRIGGNNVQLFNKEDPSFGVDFEVCPVNSVSCVGNDCVSISSYINHYSFYFGGYHSAGVKVSQISGGTSKVYTDCCNSGGTLVNKNGQKQCRYRTEGDWVFDVELKEWIPNSPNAGYRYTNPERCSYTALRNVLRAKTIFVTPSGAIVCPKCDVVGTNTREVKAGEYLFTALGMDLGPYYIDDVIGLCGYGESSRGGVVRCDRGNKKGFCQ